LARKNINTGVQSAIKTLLILGILLAINAISLYRFKRWDLTERKQYTISDVSIDAVRSLDDPVFIRCFFSGKLPPFLRSVKQEVLDLLVEYQTHAGSKINVEVIDPTDDLKLQLRAKGFRIPEVQFSVIEENKVQLLNAYFGIAVEYETEDAVIPLITTTSTLEYDLTSKDYRTITTELLKHYKLMEVDTRAGEAVSDEVDTLIVARPIDITERDKYEIDQFLMRGGKLVFLIDTVEFTGVTLDTRLIPNHLYDLLEHYGIEIPYDVVLDPKFNAQTTFQSDLTKFKINYPFWPMITSRHMNRTNPATTRLESIVFPWTSPVYFAPEYQSEVDFTSLANTGPRAWAEGGTENNLKPRQAYPPPKDQTPRSLSVVGILSGRFKSFFAEKPIPLPDEKYRKENSGEDHEPEKILISPPTHIVAVGSSRFIMNHYLTLFPSNKDFFLNLTDWLNSGEDLISIRSRHSFDRPLEKTSESKKTMLKYANIFSVSILVMVFGLVRWLWKRRAQRKFEALFDNNSD
jgi:ABC-type uncharacterized transport system involved in gliding motility auxiliary subunit